MTRAGGERALEVDGATLRYVVEGAGSGVPIAFAHGWCSKLEHWAPQAEHLAGAQCSSFEHQPCANAIGTPEPAPSTT